MFGSWLKFIFLCGPILSLQEAHSCLDQGGFSSYFISRIYSSTGSWWSYSVIRAFWCHVAPPSDHVDPKRLTGSSIDVSEVPERMGMPSTARYGPCSCSGSVLQLALGHVLSVCALPFGLISETAQLYWVAKGGQLICHRDMIKVPLAIKTRMLTTISTCHTPITGGTTNPPASSNLPQGTGRPHHYGRCK